MDALADTFVKIEADESITDVERDFARVRVNECKNYPGLLATSDVVDTLIEIIDNEKPVLRYQVPRNMGEDISKVLVDSTGETAVALREKSMKAE